jgi:mRNA-degrading endonuclease toxin of MazEF toxin-antitoxin module
LGTAEGSQSGLRQNSMVQCENLLTYDQNLILTKIGKLLPALMDQIDRCLSIALDLK